MSTSTIQLDADSSRIAQVIRGAAAAAYRTRVNMTLGKRIHVLGVNDLNRSKLASGIGESQWDAVRKSLHNASSPAEFQAFARVLRVSPRWLATGQAGFTARSTPGPYEAPPVGWESFGTHARHDGAGQLEFSKRQDDEGFPLWERVHVHVQPALRTLPVPLDTRVALSEPVAA